MSAAEFFREIALPIWDRFWRESDKALLWASVVSVNQIPDHMALEKDPHTRKEHDDEVRRIRKSDPRLAHLALIAEALKHGKKIDKLGEQAAFATARADLLSMPKFLAEPNVLASWVIDVDGESFSIVGSLKDAIECWSARL
jgi:hypothetical protein